MDLNICAAASENFIEFAVENLPHIELGWIAQAISWIFRLFSGYGAVILGVIVFTLILKTIVLPLDVYSRVKTKKQSLLMKSMRPEMEKLQKQYADDKQMYQQKVMELQKAHGYNPLGACLPTIISLIIFFFIFTSFSTYSNYAMLSKYNDMVDAYNQSVVTYVIKGEEDTASEHFLIEIDGNYKVDFDKFTAYYSTVKSDFKADEFNAMTEAEKFEVVALYVKENCREAAAERYRTNKDETTFGWINNVWYPDSMFYKEFPDYQSFSSSVSRAIGSGVSSTYEESYNEVTFNLSTERNQSNGYFVLIVLAIGLMFLQQFIMMRAQKDANELSTVDGSAAAQNKTMMIMMPLIFGVVSFLYSAAFSVYMIVNTLYGLISTLIINKVVTVRYNNKEENLSKGRRPMNRKR